MPTLQADLDDNFCTLETFNLGDSGFSNTNKSEYFSISNFNDNVSSLQIDSNELSFIHVNIRSIRNKFDTFLDYIKSLKHKFSIISYMVSENRIKLTFKPQVPQKWLKDMIEDTPGQFSTGNQTIFPKNGSFSTNIVCSHLAVR